VPEDQTGYAAALDEDLQRFRDVRKLTNHWKRDRPPHGHYWYITFENSPALRHLAAQCQDALAFPFYDPVPPGGLHMTLGRIDHDATITSERLHAIEAAATRACAEIAPFTISIGGISGTTGAIGLSAWPKAPIQHLRELLQQTTTGERSTDTGDGFHAHVALGYCNADNVDPTHVRAAIDRLDVKTMRVPITTVALVALKRHPHSYEWEPLSRVSIGG
jgi:2'-5' RNA ligase